METIGIMEKKMETLGIMEKKMETPGILEKKMATTAVYWGYIGIMKNGNGAFTKSLTLRPKPCKAQTLHLHYLQVHGNL